MQNHPFLFAEISRHRCEFAALLLCTHILVTAQLFQGADSGAFTSQQQPNPGKPGAPQKPYCDPPRLPKLVPGEPEPNEPLPFIVPPEPTVPVQIRFLGNGLFGIFIIMEIIKVTAIRNYYAKARRKCLDDATTRYDNCKKAAGPYAECDPEEYARRMQQCLDEFKRDRDACLDNFKDPYDDPGPALQA